MAAASAVLASATTANATSKARMVFDIEEDVRSGTKDSNCNATTGGLVAQARRPV